MVEIFDDRIEISNPRELLFGKEELGWKSVARNPAIFDMFRLELIEKVGSGINRIKNATAQKGLKIEFQIDKFFTVIFHRFNDSLGLKVEAQEAHAGAQEAHAEIIKKLTENEVKILKMCVYDPASSKDIQLKLGIKRSGSFKHSLNKLLKLELLSQTIPDKPSSPKQKYKTTELAKAMIKMEIIHDQEWTPEGTFNSHFSYRFQSSHPAFLLSS